MLGKWYAWLWFRTEFWLTLEGRRPFTFIMRDFIFTNVVLSLILIVLFYAGMVILSFWYGTASTLIVGLGSFVLAHIVWGETWLFSQQEDPEYLGG